MTKLNFIVALTSVEVGFAASMIVMYVMARTSNSRLLHFALGAMSTITTLCGAVLVGVATAAMS